MQSRVMCNLALFCFLHILLCTFLLLRASSTVIGLFPCLTPEPLKLSHLVLLDCDINPFAFVSPSPFLQELWALQGVAWCLQNNSLWNLSTKQALMCSCRGGDGLCTMCPRCCIFLCLIYFYPHVLDGEDPSPPGLTCEPILLAVEISKKLSVK